MNELISLFAVLLAVFLFGMAVMRIGLDLWSEKYIRKMLLTATDAPWKGFLIGMAVTAVVQSSSVVMVMTVGLAASGIIRFKQTVGIILGANIGTTITVEMITLDIGHAVIPLLLTGAGLLFFRRRRIFAAGCILFGIGAVLVSMNGLEQLAEPLAEMKFVHEWLTMTDHHHVMGAAAGTLFTALIQSSSAATGIVMAFVEKGQLSLQSAAAFVLGANIGTCFTAWIASWGANKEAKMAAFVHIGLNTAGVILFLPFIEQLCELASLLSAFPDRQLAHLAVLFNTLCSLAVLPFANRIGDFCERLFNRPKPF